MKPNLGRKEERKEGKKVSGFNSSLIFRVSRGKELKEKLKMMMWACGEKRGGVLWLVRAAWDAAMRKRKGGGELGGGGG